MVMYISVCTYNVVCICSRITSDIPIHSDKHDCDKLYSQRILIIFLNDCFHSPLFANIHVVTLIVYAGATGMPLKNHWLS